MMILICSDLVGPIPYQLCSLISLRRLCICRCGLTGKIPDEIGQLVQLEELQLFGNHLSGFIPNSIGNLKNLKLLSLGEYTGGNDFTSAPIPNCIALLVNLEALFMANCNIRGILPDWLCKLKGNTTKYLINMFIIIITHSLSRITSIRLTKE
jgi:hypothetical protein